MALTTQTGLRRWLSIALGVAGESFERRGQCLSHLRLTGEP